MRPTVALWICAGTLLFATASVSTQGPTADRPVPFKVGETLTYDVSWSTYVTAATATMTVQGRRPSGASTVYDLVAEGRPGTLLDKLYHLYYKAESLLDTRTLQPTMATVFSDERGRTKLRSTRFLSRTSIEFEPRENEPKVKHTVPPLSQDPLSAMYVLRAVPMRAGMAFTMPVCDGTDVYNAHWQIAGPEALTTPIGSFQAWRVTPTLSDEHGKPLTTHKVIMWLSNDARKLPLKLQVTLPVGNFTLTLTKVTG